MLAGDGDDDGGGGCEDGARQIQSQGFQISLNALIPRRELSAIAFLFSSLGGAQQRRDVFKDTQGECLRAQRRLEDEEWPPWPWTKIIMTFDS